MPGTTTSPSVFISYSHDSQEHKEWVLQLCLRLCAAGIDAYCDQTRRRFGTDLSLFMDRAARADRWLCIITPEYTRKVNAGIGGAGYERMAIARQLMRSIDTDKFIPVIRVKDHETSWEQAVPSLLGTRWAVDLQDGPQYEQQFAELVEDLRSASASPASSAAVHATRSNAPTDQTADQVIAQLIGLSLTDRVARGQLLMREWRRSALARLKTLAEQSEAPGAVTSDAQRIAVIKAAVTSVAPWLVGMLSDGLPGYSALTAPTDEFLELLSPSGWESSRGAAHRGLPPAIAYFAHIWLGAARIKTGKLAQAVDFAAATLPGHHVAFAFDTELLGAFRYLRSDGVRSSLAMLMDGFETWPWLHHYFDNVRDYRVHCVAYLLSLHLNEFAAAARACATGESDPERLRGGQWTLAVPPLFLRDDDGLVEDAYARMQRQGGFSRICDRNNVGAPYLVPFFTGWKRAIATRISSYGSAPWASLPYSGDLPLQAQDDD